MPGATGEQRALRQCGAQVAGQRAGIKAILRRLKPMSGASSTARVAAVRSPSLRTWRASSASLIAATALRASPCT